MLVIDQIQLIGHQWLYKFKLARKLSMCYDTTSTRFIYCDIKTNLFIKVFVTISHNGTPEFTISLEHIICFSWMFDMLLLI